MRLTALALLGFGALAACSSGSSSGSSASDITSVTPPAPVQQSIGNCWVFATNAWIETLSGRTTGSTAVDLSEAYVSYIYWFNQIVAPPPENGPELFTLQVLGSWGQAADILTHYGWLPEATFLSEPATTTFADRHAAAYTAIQHEIDHGALQTKAERANRKLVAATMAKAWGLKPDVVAALTTAFGDDFSRDLVKGNATLTGTPLHDVKEITVGYSGSTPVTVADLFGTQSADSQIAEGLRDGPFAFSDIRPPGSDDKTHAYLQRVQKMLLQDFPIVMSETSDDVDLDSTGTYRKPADLTLHDMWYDHAVMVFDLSVQTTQFGLLPAGTVETRPAAIAASLADDSNIVSFRARNSYWGSYAPGTSISFAGGVAVNDYTTDYLLWRPNFAGGRMLMRMAVPNNDLTLAKSPQ